jgi:hypothetical protein
VKEDAKQRLFKESLIHKQVMLDCKVDALKAKKQNYTMMKDIYDVKSMLAKKDEVPLTNVKCNQASTMRYLTHNFENTVFKHLKPNTKIADGELEDNPVQKKKFQKLTQQKINEAVKLNDLCIYL